MMELDRLYNMDCLEGMKAIPDKSVDLIVTDPPYDIHSGFGGGIMKGKDKEYLNEILGISNGFSYEILDECCRVMRAINIYIFCSLKQIIPLTDYFVTNKKCSWNLLSWHKENPVPACGNKYLTDTEYLLFFREKGVKLYGNFDTKRTYYVSPINQSDKELYHHPTIKPFPLVRRLVFNSSREGDIILDPFIGSGTTAVACINEKRHFIGYELNPEYYKIATRRIDFERRQTSLF